MFTCIHMSYHSLPFLFLSTVFQAGCADLDLTFRLHSPPPPSHSIHVVHCFVLFSFFLSLVCISTLCFFLLFIECLWLVASGAVYFPPFVIMPAYIWYFAVAFPLFCLSLCHCFHSISMQHIPSLMCLFTILVASFSINHSKALPHSAEHSYSSIRCMALLNNQECSVV